MQLLKTDFTLKEGQSPKPQDRRTLTGNKPMIQELIKLAFHISDKEQISEGNSVLCLIRQSISQMLKSYLHSPTLSY